MIQLAVSTYSLARWRKERNKNLVQSLRWLADNDVKGVEMLLEGGCSVNAADYDKRTALHLASSTGNSHVVSVLIEHKADLNPTRPKCTAD